MVDLELWGVGFENLIKFFFCCGSIIIFFSEMVYKNFFRVLYIFFYYFLNVRVFLCGVNKVNK